MAKKKTKPDTSEEQVPLRFRIPVGMSSKLAQHLLVQDLGEVVQLSFFEAISPPIIQSSSPEENLARLKELGIVAECVARLNVPASRFQSFADVMQQIAKDITSDLKELES